MMRIVCLLFTVALVLSTHTGQAAPPALNPEQVVRQWADASRTIAEPGKSVRQRLIYEHRDELNGHQLGLLVECRGPVDVEDLLGRYRFTKAVRSADSIRLTAVPRDDLERLFMGRFRVTLGTRTNLPSALDFVGRTDATKGIQVAIAIPTEELMIRDGGVEPPPELVLTAGQNLKDRNLVKTAAAELEGDDEQELQRLREILRRWKAAVSRVAVCRADYRCFMYDHVFHFEKRSEGTLLYIAPDKGRLETRPSQVDGEALSGMKTKEGERYSVRPDDSEETWIWSNEKWFWVSHKSKNIDVFNKPSVRAPVRVASFDALWRAATLILANRVLPAVGGWSPKLFSDFNWRLIDETPTSIRLRGVPATEVQKQVYAELWIDLDAKTFRTSAVKFVDPSRNSERVYILRNVKTNFDDPQLHRLGAEAVQPPEHEGYQLIEHGR